MIRGIYISASAAINDTKRIDVLANNIANVNTTGFKKDQTLTQSFPEVLVSRIHDGLINKDTFQNQGGRNFTSENQGDLMVVSTSSGFFNVKTPEGNSRSRSVTFSANSEGYLVTPQGNYVMGLKGPIKTGDAPVTVDNKGQVLAGGTVIDQLQVTNPYNVIGNLSYGVNMSEVYTNFEQGSLAPTENSFDLAIQGKGFFSIETPEGERYTRDGSFTKSADGYLVTAEGYRVLGQKGPMKIDGDNMSVNEKGEVISGGNLIDQLKLVDFKDTRMLRKQGDGLFSNEATNGDNFAAFSGTVEQGYQEASNINAVREMVDMMTVMRSYEANQKIIKIHDELLGKAVSEIGRV